MKKNNFGSDVVFMCGRSTNLEDLVALQDGGAGIKLVHINTTPAEDTTTLALGTSVQLDVADIHLAITRSPLSI